MSESGARLTTSRINRLLRPLRNKCNGLASLPKSNWDPDRPPLAVPCPSARANKSADRFSADELELSRRIHAVCDAFKNIAYVAFSQPCSDRIPSLAAMCTLVVGKNMPSAPPDGLSVDFDELDVDDIYEIVPPHYRRFLVVSHALLIILRTCTHHHALVTILLEHCLSFGLIHESTHLLDIILGQAFLPSDSVCPPPATHPAHTNYLLDLHAKWVTGNNSSVISMSSTRSLLFTTSAFCQAVLRTLSRSSSCNLETIWTSKVLNKIFHVVESCDIDSYITMIHALLQDLGVLGSSPRLAMLREKLSELMSNLFDLIFASHASPPSPSRICAAIDILFDCHAARLHCLRITTPYSSIDLPDIIVIFATHIFVAYPSSNDNSDHIFTILEESSPVPSTFSKLMAYFARVRESHSFGDSVEAFLGELKRYSSALRSEKLYGLDASLWACGLHHFETSMASSEKANSILVTKYKRKLMEAVDEAERRCFGRDMDSSPNVLLPVRSKRAQRSRLSGHWEWEDMVGSWIRKTPVPKKRKICDGRPDTPSRHMHNQLRPLGVAASKPLSGSIPVSKPMPTHHRRFVPSSSPSFSSQLSESPTEDGSEYQYETDKEVFRSPVVKRSHPIKRRSSNFSTLLADAQINRIVLHSKTRPKLLSVVREKHVSRLSSQQSRRASRKQEPEMAGQRKAAPPPRQSQTLLLSDDSLDLFAYATSSPARR